MIPTKSILVLLNSTTAPIPSIAFPTPSRATGGASLRCRIDRAAAAPRLAGGGAHTDDINAE